MTVTLSKEQGISIGYSTVLAWITIIPAVWFLAKPLIVDAVADDLGSRIQKETKPLGDAFKLLLQRDITEMRRQITAMEFQREQNLSNWTLEDAQELSRLRNALRAHERALSALEEGGL